MFGLGSVAQVVTGQGDFGHYISINLGFGLAVAMGVHVGGKVSGKGAPPPSLFGKKKQINQPQVVVLKSGLGLETTFQGSQSRVRGVFTWSCLGLRLDRLRIFWIKTSGGFANTATLFSDFSEI